MQLGQIGSAMSELSQLLSQAIVVPFRRPARAGGRNRVRALLRAGGSGRGFATRYRGTLWLAAGSIPDEMVVDLIHQAGGRRADALLLPAAAYGCAEAGERYRRYLQRFGMDRAQTVAVSTRRQAEDPALAARIGAADLVVLAGGEPNLLLQVMRDTPVAEALAGALLRGGAVAAVGPVCEAVGEWALPPTDEPAGGGRTAGLGLIPGTIVAAAPHLSGRIAALFGAALTGGAQALLLDARTAVVVRPGWQAEVRSGAVVAVGTPPESRREQPGHRPPVAAGPVGGVWTRVAPAGWRLDLAARALLPPGSAAATSD